ncbi:MAG: hypothetical protein ACLPXB_17960 [Thiobacillaceae bacterium]
MKRMVSLLAVIVLTYGSMAFAQDTPAGPFGFTAGMSREQIIKLVGASAIRKLPVSMTDPHYFALSTAPIPNPAFETYALTVSPTQGLVRLSAIGVTLETGDTGAELQTAFHGVVSAISRKYGEAKVYDRCSGNSTECDNSEFWMMSLKSKNRELIALWILKQPVNGVTAIEAMVNYTTMNSGYIDVQYEFIGFDQYNAAKKAKQDASY